MKTQKINFRKITCGIIILVTVTFNGITFLECAEDKKEEMMVYFKQITPIINNVDMTVRNAGFNRLPMKDGARRISESIKQMSLVTYPEGFSRLHKMMLLSFKKIRIGLFLFSIEKKELCVGLIKSGSRLLKAAAQDILAIGRKEGIIKPAPAPEEKREGDK